MKIACARQILRSLAGGIDPYTGDHFPADGPYQRADTVHTLYTALEILESGAKPKKPVDPTKPRAGGRWAPEEEQRLRDAYAHKPIEGIARDHGRTPGAITARLVAPHLPSRHPPTSNQLSSPATRLAVTRQRLRTCRRCAPHQTSEAPQPPPPHRAARDRCRGSS